MKASADFASAAMMRLIQLGLEQQGLSVEKTASADKSPASARVALSNKQAVVSQLHQAFGTTAVLRIGEAVHIAPDEPALVALAMARDPADLLARWQRLERFVHSRHRVHAQAPMHTHTEVAGKHQIELQHRSLNASHPPTAAEDLLVLGLVALLSRTGTQQLQARFVGDRTPRWQHGSWRDAKLPIDTSRWLLAWQPAAAIGPVLSGRPSDDEVSAATTASKLLAADVGRAWTVASLAKEMTTSARHLQRGLQARQTSFSGLLCGARLTQAAKLLVGTQQSSAEIGYACGYADQSHFNREFKRHTALTPAAYRTEFANRSPA